MYNVYDRLELSYWFQNLFFNQQFSAIIMCCTNYQEVFQNNNNIIAFRYFRLNYSNSILILSFYLVFFLFKFVYKYIYLCVWGSTPSLVKAPLKYCQILQTHINMFYDTVRYTAFCQTQIIVGYINICNYILQQLNSLVKY